MLFGNLGGRYAAASRDAGYAALRGIGRLSDLLAALEIGEASDVDAFGADASRLLRESFGQFDRLARTVAPEPLARATLPEDPAFRYEQLERYAESRLGIALETVSDLPRVCARQLERLANLVDLEVSGASFADARRSRVLLLEMARTISIGSGVAHFGSLLEFGGYADA